MCRIDEDDLDAKLFFDGVRLLGSGGFDYEEANDCFKLVKNGRFKFYASIFRAYINICVWPFDSDYVDDLLCYEDDPAALYVIALHYKLKLNDYENFQIFNERSIGLKPIPASLILKAESYGFHERKHLMGDIEKIVKNKRVEFSKDYGCLYISAIRLYKELILNSYMTSINWDDLQKRLV